MTNAKNKITRRTVAKITKSKVELNEGDEESLGSMCWVYSGLR